MQLLLLLLVLSSASLQEAVKNHALEEKVPPLTPDLKGGFSGIISNVTISRVRRILPPTEPRNKREVNSYPSVFDPNSKLRWEKWNHVLPNGTVSIYNDYTGRTDYVCKYKCHSGFYTSIKGPYCHYPYDGEERTAESFEILVNEDDFEKLEWKEGSYGSVPEHAVSSCSSNSMYVGRNKYGLGTVYPKDKCFYLPWDGSEYWYKRTYEVLTANMDVKREFVSDVKYNIDQAEILKNPPKVFKTSTIKNANCRPVTKTISLTTKTSETSMWDYSFSQMFGAKVSFEAKIPFIGDSKIEFSSETRFQYSWGKSVTDETTQVTSFDLTVPPNHSCIVKLVGFQYNTKIPFTARLTRTYRTGETTWTGMSGTYHGVQSSEVNVEVDRCEPLPSSKPCA